MRNYNTDEFSFSGAPIWLWIDPISQVFPGPSQTNNSPNIRYTLLPGPDKQTISEKTKINSIGDVFEWSYSYRNNAQMFQVTGTASTYEEAVKKAREAALSATNQLNKPEDLPKLPETKKE